MSDSIDIINAFRLIDKLCHSPGTFLRFTVGTWRFGGDFGLFNFEVFQFCPG